MSASALAQSPIASMMESSVLPGKPSVKLAAQPAITGQFFTEFYKDLDQSAKISVLVDKLAPLTVEERDAALRSFKDANKIPSAKKEGKTVVDPVAAVRASEIKALHIALSQSLADAREVASMGYHKAVAFARQVINDAKLDLDGETKLDSTEKKQAKELKVQADAMAQALIDNPIQTNESMLDHIMQRVAGILESAKVEALDRMDDARAESIAKRLIEKENNAVLAKLVHLLDAHLQATAQVK